MGAASSHLLGGAASNVDRRLAKIRHLQTTASCSAVAVLLQCCCSAVAVLLDAVECCCSAVERCFSTVECCFSTVECCSSTVESCLSTVESCQSPQSVILATGLSAFHPPMQLPISRATNRPNSQWQIDQTVHQTAGRWQDKFESDSQPNSRPSSRGCSACGRGSRGIRRCSGRSNQTTWRDHNA